MSFDFAVQKILESSTDGKHYISSFSTDLLLTQKIAYVPSGNGAGQAEYVGYAIPGTASSDTGWLIKKLTYDSSNRVTDVQFAGGKAEFTKIWDSRTGYSFS